MSRVYQVSAIILIAVFSSTYILAPAAAGTLEFDGVPVDITTADGEDLVIVPGTGGNVQIGDAAGTDTNATSNDDLYVTGVLEADGALYADGGIMAGSNVLPSIDAEHNLGSSAKNWNNLYITNIYAGDLPKIKNVTYSWPSAQGAAGTVLRNDGAGNLTWGAGGGGGASLPVVDTTDIVSGSLDATKLLRFEVDGLTTGTTRTLTVQDVNGTIYVSGGTDVPILDGGTGASDVTGAQTNLGLLIGTNVQAWDADLDTWALRAPPTGTVVGTTDTQMLTNKALVDTSTSLINVLDNTKVVKFNAANLTTGTTRTLTVPDANGTLAVSASSPVTLSAAGDIGLGTVPVNKGGTSTTTAPTDGQLLLGKSDGTYAVASLTAGSNITLTPGDGSLTIAATAGSSLPVVDTEDIVMGSVDATKLMRFEVDGLTTGTTRTLTVQDVDGTIYVSGGTDVPILDGGTGASDATTARSNLGLVIGTNVQAWDTDLDTWSSKSAPASAVVGASDAQQLTNKTLVDTSTVFADDLDITKAMKFQLANVTTATTRTLTVPDADGTLAVSATAPLSLSSAGNLSLATIPINKGGTGTTVAPSDGKLLIGKTDGSYAVANLTAGANITITDGDGTISIAASTASAPTNSTYVTQTPDAGLSNEQALSLLGTGVLKNTTGTGVLSIAAQGTDYYAPGGTDVAVLDGGTGASDAAGARTNLGLVIGTNVQAWDSDLDTWAAKTPPSSAVVGTTDTQQLSNKTLIDSTTSFGDDLDGTKLLKLQLSGLTTATTRTINVPDANGTFAVSASAPVTLSSAGNISVADFAASGGSHASGLVPDPGAIAGTTKFLREDATWAAIPTGGDVSGPASSVDNSIVRFDGTGGKTIQGYTSGAPTISDTGALTMNANVLLNGNYLSNDGGNEGIFVDTAGQVGIGTNGPGDLLDVQGGNIRTSSLAGTGNRCVYADANGVLHVKADDCGLAGAAGDDLGNHTASQNIILGGNWLSGDGANEGVRIDTSGNVGVGVNTVPTSALEVNGAVTVREIAAPTAAAANTGRIYFDSTADKFKVSESTGSYVDLVPSGGAAPTAASYITQTAESGLSGEQALSALSSGLLKNTTGTGVLSVATEGTDYYKPGGTDVSLADGGTGASLIDPNANRLLFWDDTGGNMSWLTVGSNLSITGSTLNAAGDTLPVVDTTAIAKGSVDPTKLVRLEVDGLTASTTRALTIQDVDGTVYVSGGTDIPVTDGGTGASDAAGARTNLGLVIGTNIQAWDTDLDSWASKTPPTSAVVGTSDTQQLTNKTFIDSTTSFGDDLDGTKLLKLQLSGLTTATTRTINVPDANGTFAVSASAPVSLSAAGNISVPDFAASGGSHASGLVPDPGAVSGSTKFLREDASWAVPTFTEIGDVSSVGDCSAGDCFTGVDGSVLTFKGASSGTTALQASAVAGANTQTLQAVTGTIYVSGGTDIPVLDGGTGASDVTTARSNLGLAIGTNVQAWDTDLDTWASKTAPTGTVVGTTDTQMLTNKSLEDNSTKFVDQLDITKELKFQLSGLTTATTRTLTVPDADGTLAISATTPVSLSAAGDISVADFVASGGSHARGLVPDPGAAAGTTKFLREDATWVVVPTEDNVTVNSTAAADVNFLDVAATGTTAGTTWTLNAASTPDDLSLAISDASATTAGVITTGVQTIAGSKTFSDMPTVSVGDANNNAISALRLERVNSTAVGGDGLGAGLQYYLENDASAMVRSGRIDSVWEDSASSSEASSLHFSVTSFGSDLEVMKIMNTGYVGIDLGSQTPQASLDIKQTQNSTGILRLQRITDINPWGDYINVQNAAGNASLFRIGRIPSGDNLEVQYSGALTLDESTAPDVSAVDQGRIYFDTTDNKFKVSENNGAYTDLINLNAVTGPASSTDNAIVRFDGTTGKVIQDYTSGAPTISDTGDVTLGGGKSVYGGSAANDDLVLEGTSHATKATSYINLQPTGGYVGIGTTSPETTLHVAGNQSIIAATNPQLRVSDDLYASGTRKEMVLGYVTGADYGRIDIYHQGTGARPLILQDQGGSVGIGNITPGTKFDLDGAMTFREMAAPSNAPLDQGRIYFDTTANKFRVSENNGAYVDLLGGASAPLDATYITQTANGSLTNEQALSALSTGLMKVTTGTGVVSSVTDSAGLAGSLSDEIGSAGGGVAVFSNAPTLTSPVIKGEAVVALTPGANIATNAALGNVFTIAHNANATLDIPTNPTNGQKCIWRFKNTDVSAHTLTLTTAGAGSFRFGNTVAGTSATPAGKTDYIGAIYNLTDDKWDVIAYAKGYV